jgi:hypothetical protein
LWWHPHNFGSHIDESMQFLSSILAEFRALRDKFGFRSMSMAEAAHTAAVLKSPATVTGFGKTLKADLLHTAAVLKSPATVGITQP